MERLERQADQGWIKLGMLPVESLALDALIREICSIRQPSNPCSFIWSILIMWNHVKPDFPSKEREASAEFLAVGVADSGVRFQFPEPKMGWCSSTVPLCRRIWMDCHGLSLPWHGSLDLPFKPKWSWEAFNCFKKAPSESSEAPLFIFFYICLWSFFPHVLGMFVSGISGVLQSYSQFYHDIIIRDTTLYTIVFTVQPALDLRLRPKEAGRFATPAMTWTHSENLHGFLGAVDLEAGSKWNKTLVGGLEHVLFSIIYGMSSFPLTNMFQDG